MIAAFVPLTVIVDSPVIAEPGDTPRSPVSVVAPVLVTVEAPRTEKVVRSGPRIPSAFALGIEKEKIAKDRIKKEKTEKRPILRILNTSVGGIMEETGPENCANRDSLSTL
jgi:hypothetical protein